MIIYNNIQTHVHFLTAQNIYTSIYITPTLHKHTKANDQVRGTESRKKMITNFSRCPDA